LVEVNKEVINRLWPVAQPIRENILKDYSYVNLDMGTPTRFQRFKYWLKRKIIRWVK